MTPKKKAFKANYPKIFRIKEEIDWIKKKKTPFEILYIFVYDYVVRSLRWISTGDRNPDYPPDDPVFSRLEKMPLVEIKIALENYTSDVLINSILKDMICDPAGFLPLVEREEKLKRNGTHGPAGRVLMGLINGSIHIKLQGL